MQDAFVYPILGVHAAVAGVLAVRLWRREVGVLTKLWWSVVLLVPVVGLFAYGALYKPPSVLPRHLQDHRERKGGW
ncbi:MAG: hypothetical protein AAGA11_20765 [Pseudomonadota bacterium]